MAADAQVTRMSIFKVLAVCQTRGHEGSIFREQAARTCTIPTFSSLSRSPKPATAHEGNGRPDTWQVKRPQTPMRSFVSFFG